MENSGVGSSGKISSLFLFKYKVWRRSTDSMYAGSTFLEFDDVVVPAENLLGKENQGFEIIMSSTLICPLHTFL